MATQASGGQHTTAEPIRVVVCGATGAVGEKLVPAILARSDVVLTGAVGRRGHGEDVGTWLGLAPAGVRITGSVDDALAAGPCDVLVDYTAPDAAVVHSRAALQQGVSVFVGTTGLDAGAVDDLGALAEQHAAALFLAPNMTVSGQLMFRCAELLRPYFGDIEIIETHPPTKPDSPSGTSIDTAERLGRVDGPAPSTDHTSFGLPESRGATVGNVRIHSLRLASVYDRQEVLFARPDELFTLRFDQFSTLPLVEPTLRAVRLLVGRRGLLRELPGLFT